MKAILISTLPKACKAIASGEQTLLLTKRLPKIETPFKTYLYCRKGGEGYFYTTWIDENRLQHSEECLGKVIGEFVGDKLYTYKCHNGLTKYGGELGLPIGTYDSYLIFECDYKAMCLSYDDVKDYGKGKTLYGWHISELKIYDKPKKLSEFRKPCLYGDLPCWECPSCDRDEKDNLIQCFNTLSRPPQSWCYVEELEESDHV